MKNLVKIFLAILLGTSTVFAQVAGPVAAVPGTPGAAAVYGTPINGTPVIIPGTVIPTNGKNVLTGTVTATTATTAPATITGVTTSSVCVFSAANAIAAAAIIADNAFLTPTANTVTLTFSAAPATTGGIFKVLCTVN